MAVILVTQILLSLPAISSAQATSTTTKNPQTTTKSLTIDTAEVVYVSGDDAVLKMPDGRLQLFELNPGTSLTIDGKPSTVADLTPGTTISHVQMQGRTEYEVTTVNQFEGTITAKQGRFLTVRLNDGTSKIYRVPHHATFNVGGNPTSFDNVTRGMRITVTAVTTEGLSRQTSNAAKVGQTPPQSASTLVIEK
jgi:hypothetical protein